MRDEAVSPVIAVMLILAAIVTFLSVWNAIYIPSVKESAEIGHLHEVESAFEQFSSDLERAVSLHQDNLVFSQPVPLGGGDVMVNLIKSSGTLQVQNETDPIYTLSLVDGQGDVTREKGMLVNFSYEPVSNFWQNQGYTWQYGYINVTKYGTLSTPLNYYNMTDVENEISSPGPVQTLAKSVVAVSASTNTTSLAANGGISGINRNCSSLDLWAVNVDASSQHHVVSSNGFGTLRLTTTVTSVPYFDLTDISLGSDNDIFGNVTLDSWNTSVVSAMNSCPANIRFAAGDSTVTYRHWNIHQDVSPVNVTLHQVNVEVSVS